MTMMQPLTHDELREFSRALDRKLTEADLDAREAVIQDEAQRVIDRRANRVPRIPRVCDQHGRYPQAAEACTEIGADDEPLRAATGLVWGVILGLCLWAVIAFAALALWPAVRAALERLM